MKKVKSYKLLQGDRRDRRFLTVQRLFKTTDKSLIAGKTLNSNSSYDVFVCEGDRFPEKKGHLNHCGRTASFCVSFVTFFGFIIHNSLTPVTIQDFNRLGGHYFSV